VSTRRILNVDEEAPPSPNMAINPPAGNAFLHRDAAPRSPAAGYGRRWPAGGYLMFIERRVVDNRVLLLGLDKLYRDAMKQHERGRRTTSRLSASLPESRMRWFSPLRANQSCSMPR
jgi:hypothetical protein